MRTTLNLDDDLMRAVKQNAAMSGRTVTALIETALRELLAREAEPDEGYRLGWVTVSGGAQAGVDLTDRDSLLRRMEEEDS
jgi:predicted transcriptional regulator